MQGDQLPAAQCKRCLGIARLAAVSDSRDGHSFNCKCSIPSSYPASHCPGIASIFGGPSGNRGASLGVGGSVRTQTSDLGFEFWVSSFLAFAVIQLLPLSQLHDHAFKPGDLYIKKIA